MSATRIQLLSPRLANQIAAGEVVERPASVVKELLENSLDAGASRIDIEIERGGIQLIRISDNGSGIHPDDLALALARHATSKIASIDDLAAVASLGFRGEALASIASVAKLLLISRRRGEAQAWQAFAEGAGMQVHIQPAALNEGTRIDVRDLFFNTPARRRFLRSEATEFAHIDDTVRRVALARPEVSFSLRHNGRGVRQLRAIAAADPLPARVAVVLGRSFLVSALPLDVQLDSVRLHGFVGHPDQHRAQADGQFVFVNGRAIRDRVISHALRAGFAARIPAGRSPCYALFLSLPASDVDVNVHPTKHEVRFRNARWLHDWLTRSINDALSDPAASLASSQRHSSALHVDTETGEVLGSAWPHYASATSPSAHHVRESVAPAVAGYAATAAGSWRASPDVFAPVARSIDDSAQQNRDAADIAPPNAKVSTVFAVSASGSASDQPLVQKLSAELLLEWAAPPRIWSMPDVLAAWLETHWLGSASVHVMQTPTRPSAPASAAASVTASMASLPLLLPLPLPASFAALTANELARFGRYGFQLQDGQLRAAPACLRGADWPSLLDTLLAAPESEWAALASSHLLGQPCSQQTAFWQPLICWAGQQAASLGMVPTAAQWESLWPRR